MRSSRRAFLTKLTAGLSIPFLVDLERMSAIAAAGDRETILSQRRNTPDGHFDLRGWKLQIPGPKEVKNLGRYSSEYFYLDSSEHMCFWVDCSETGYTTNSDYVRSELRHLGEWSVNDSAPKVLSAQVSVNSHANPDKVTVLQVHSTNSNGRSIPPLLRIALNHGSLRAFVKTDNSGNRTESIVLDSNVSGQAINCAIEVHDGRLIISINGTEKVNRDISFWQHPSYFKAGCYPQSNRGTVTAKFSHLSVEVS
ncbi:MAG: polysaccharide lyase family 7 protein [Phormidesmis sp.]